MSADEKHAPVIDLAAHRKAKATEDALAELRRVDMAHMLALAADFTPEGFLPWRDALTS
jgi:hypothetical protein